MKKIEKNFLIHIKIPVISKTKETKETTILKNL